MSDYKGYKCTDCGVTGLKLWRDYGYCNELWCALCCEKLIAAKARAPDPWDEPPGPLDMMRYGFSGVAAIPSDGDCDSYQSSGAYKSDGLLWWHALPTFTDENREIATVMYTLRRSREDLAMNERAEQKLVQKVNGLLLRLRRPQKPVPEITTDAGYGYRHELSDARRVMMETLRLLYDSQGNRLKLYQEENDLEWILERAVYQLTKPATVTIWGSKTETIQMENGKFWTISGGEEQLVDLTPGQKIAVGKRGMAVVLLGDSFRECPTIMDHSQDGWELIDDLLKKRSIVTVEGY